MAYAAADTYPAYLTYTNPRTHNTDYQAIQNLLDLTSVEGQTTFSIINAYVDGFKSLGMSDENARAVAGFYVGTYYILDAVGTIVIGIRASSALGLPYKDPVSGLNSIKPPSLSGGSTKSAIDRLAFDPATGKTVTHEAIAAGQLENSLGGTLKRVENSASSKNADYIFTEEPYKGKTVDFMWSDSTRSTQINKFFINNLDQNLNTFISHIYKADIVQLDYRNLTPANHNLVTY